jgi:hypothetical protein
MSGARSHSPEYTPSGDRFTLQIALCVRCLMDKGDKRDLVVTVLGFSNQFPLERPRHLASSFGTGTRTAGSTDVIGVSELRGGLRLAERIAVIAGSCQRHVQFARD